MERSHTVKKVIVNNCIEKNQLSEIIKNIDTNIKTCKKLEKRVAKEGEYIDAIRLQGMV